MHARHGARPYSEGLVVLCKLCQHLVLGVKTPRLTLKHQALLACDLACQQQQQQVSQTYPQLVGSLVSHCWRLRAASA